MVKELIIILITATGSVYACERSGNAQFTIKEDTIDIDVSFPNKMVEYYTFRPHVYPPFIGIVLKQNLNLKELSQKGYVGGPSFHQTTIDDQKFLSVLDFFYGKDTNKITSYLNYQEVSEIYDVPLTEKVSVAQFHEKINITHFLNRYKYLLDASHITGVQKIKFYVKFLHNQDPIKCSYFESPEISVDLDKIAPSYFSLASTKADPELQKMYQKMQEERYQKKTTWDKVKIFFNKYL